MKKALSAIAAFLILTGLILAATKDTTADSLAKGFHSPPDSAKPWTYWWWLNGNVRKEGITKDLEEMKRQGISGVVIFQAGAGETPAGVQFLSPKWHELFRYTLAEADRLGISVSVNLCDGWDSGGPWITQDQANKKLVYAELQADGPKTLSVTMPRPPVVDGYYRDVAVIAFPEKEGKPLAPAKVTASSSLEGYVGEWNFAPEDAADGDPETYWSSADVTPPAAQPQWIEFDYQEPITATGLYVAPVPENGPRDCELQASMDGKVFSTVRRFRLEKGEAKQVDFPEVRANSFLLLIHSAYGQPARVAEAVLLRKGDTPDLRRGIKWWWFKSGNRSFWDYPRQGPAALEEEYPEDGVSDVRSSDVVDISRHMDSDARIRWDVPPGRWTILRFGYTLEGQRVRAESAGGRGGYEAGMLESAPIENHFKHTAEPMLADAAAAHAKSLKYLHIDSYELGADVRGQQPTWSEAFREEFKRRRGYALLPYLPAMARRIDDSRDVTDRFFEDFRWTVGDLMDERFWARFTQLAHSHGVSTHTETGYGTYPFPHIDGLRTAGNNDVPMGEFWYGTDIMSQFNPWANVIKTEASAAHIYGRNISQAESFTTWGHWRESPSMLKPVGDQAFVDGLNRMVFHQYTHQPLLDMKPGWQYFAGTHFDRNITWWEEAGAFFTYLARCQFLLQQGRFVADALYFYGEGVTKFVPSKQYLHPSLPPGYDFDAINADLLLHGLTVRNGRLSLPDGMTYRVLVLPEDGVMSPEVLRKIRDLATAGAIVVGPKAQRSPGLSGYPQSQAEVKRLADEIWGDCDGEKVKERKLGAGRIVCGRSMREIFESANIPPDFESSGGENSPLGFIHRSAADAEIYFVTNREDRNERLQCTFRVSGRRPELWDPVSGRTWPAAAFRQESGRTTLPLQFAPYGSLFVIFRGTIPPNAAGSASRNFPTYTNAEELTGPWTVAFDPKWGGPASVEFPELVSWTTRPEEGIKHYSGTATYRRRFDLPLGINKAGNRIALDLGKVDYVARVRLNGKDLGVVWTAPWRIEITEAVKPIGNDLEIKVVNLWPNRIIGDAALPPDKRYTKTNIVYKKDDPLLESGLLGPVRIETIDDSGM
ncbi:MAG: discoidin domain-containing protein [Acidobacteriia bacterium]|nr:discoidin domain-containing protein [Terriglobia bacterium]